MIQERVCYIGVHPYKFEYYRDQPKFICLRNNRLLDDSLDQFLFIEKKDLAGTKREFNLDRARWEGRIFTTDNADPTQTAFQEISTVILLATPADRYIIWGAELVMKEGITVAGCVEYIYRNLKLPNKEIEINACYKTPYSLYEAPLAYASGIF